MNAAIRAATLIGRAARRRDRRHRARLSRLARRRVRRRSGRSDVAGILREGGTILGSARCKEFHEREVRDRAREILAKPRDRRPDRHRRQRLADRRAAPRRSDGDRQRPPLKIVGIPASIDNDLGLTGLSIGVDTAMNTIVEACDKIADTATAHDRTFIVEVMGRDCGYLAMTSAIAVGADLALFPEAGKPEAEIVDQIVETVLAVRARQTPRAPRDHHQGRGRRRSRSTGSRRRSTRGCSERSPDAEPSSIETRVTVLGHVVRGGRPSAFDRLLGSRLANVAVRALLAGQTHKMAAWMPPVELPEEVGTRSPARPVLLARRPRRSSRRDRKFTERPKSARALESRRVRRDRGRAAVIVAVPCRPNPSCCACSIDRRSGCIARTRTVGFSSSIPRSSRCSATTASRKCSRSICSKDVYIDAEERAPVLEAYKSSGFVEGRRVHWKTRTGRILTVQLFGHVRREARTAWCSTRR